MESTQNTEWIVVTDSTQMTSRDRTAQFERLMHDNSASIVRLVAAFERNPAACEDLVQEIAIAIWKALPGFRGDCSERTLVFRIAQNRALRQLERRYRATPLGGQINIEVPDQGPSPEAAASSGELRERLLEAIRTLPTGQRQVMTLVLEGLTHAEIADVLGTSEGNVAVRAVRARQALRDRLGEIQ
jgi:RNA polymerase sigma factor (sigma-70 family)